MEILSRNLSHVGEMPNSPSRSSDPRGRRGRNAADADHRHAVGEQVQCQWSRGLKMIDDLHSESVNATDSKDTGCNGTHISQELAARLQELKPILQSQGCVVFRRDRDRRPGWRLRYREIESDAGYRRHRSLRIGSSDAVAADVEALISRWQKEHRGRVKRERALDKARALLIKRTRNCARLLGASPREVLLAIEALDMALSGLRSQSITPVR